jgi:CheY-like chemotaxis protein
LRQPLQAIRLINASMQKLTARSPDLGEMVSQQEAAIDSMTRLLNALLDISRLESGAIEPQMSPLAMAATFADLAREFDPAAKAKNIELEFAETHAVLSTDLTLFTQLLQNLISNALKYTEQGFIRVSAETDPEAMILHVEDSGVGIPADKLERVFDEYYQIGPQGTQRLGVGLGLAIVREVSRLLGYSVAVASKVGEGTRVSVRIPRHRLLPEAQAPLPEDNEPSALAGLRNCRLVLLEDNDAVRLATELFLTLEGFETRTAATVEGAELLLADMRPGDVFITDFHLDGRLTGLDVLQQLRTHQGRDVPAILLSGDLPSITRVVKDSIPNCRYLGKPVDTKALLLAIVELSGV